MATFVHEGTHVTDELIEAFRRDAECGSTHPELCPGRDLHRQAGEIADKLEAFRDDCDHLVEGVELPLDLDKRKAILSEEMEDFWFRRDVMSMLAGQSARATLPN